MAGVSFTASLMRLYARRRRALFVLLTLLAFGAFVEGEFRQNERNVPVHEGIEVGDWLHWLFKTRGDDPRELGVEIVGFDHSMKAGNYAGLLESSPALRLLSEPKGLAYDRAVYAAVLDRLVEAGASVVVFDFFFDGPGPSESGDRAFAEAIRRHRDKVVIGFDYKFVERATAPGRAESVVELRDPYEPLLPEERPESVLGFVTVWPDPDGGISHMAFREDCLTLAKPSLSAGFPSFSDMSLVARAASKLGVAVPDDNRMRIINFAGKDRTFPMTPVQDLFTPDRWSGALRGGGRFRGRPVIVGPYSEVHYKDSFPTPVGRMLGVEVQANCLRNLLDGSWLRRPLEGPWVLALAGAFLVFAFAVGAPARYHRSTLRLALMFGVPLAYLAAAVLLFGRANLFLPLLPVLYGLGLSAVFVLLDFIHAQYEKARIKGMFGAYLAPAIVDRMVAAGEEPRLGGEQVSLTAFFSDIQSFSSFSEVLTPEQLVEIMNEYLGAMTEILEADEGTLDKYIGDAIVAMFGAPVPLDDHAHRAVACALRMQKRLGELRERWKAQGARWPVRIHAMRMRIGLNTGPATVGNMGSAKRFNYTMMGDTVNLAARCESGAKSAGVYTLVTGETVEAARRSAGRPILFRKLDLWRVKGRSAPVALYEAVCFDDEAAPGVRECVRLYEEGLALYWRRDFAAARERFEAAMPLEPLLPGRDPGVEHCPSEILAARCAEYLAAPPPAGWDGVHAMKSK